MDIAFKELEFADQITDRPNKAFLDIGLLMLPLRVAQECFRHGHGQAPETPLRSVVAMGEFLLTDFASICTFIGLRGLAEPGQARVA